MKKLIVGICLLFFTIFLLNSCKKDFLERYPLDRISNTTFWNTENDLKIYNNGLYNMAGDDVNVPIMMGHHEGFDSHWSGIWYLDEYSDNIAPNIARHAFFSQTRSGKHNVPSTPQQYGWRGWNFVRAINVGLDNYNKANVPSQTLDKYAAEARLFRGWFYADKVSKFGDVPWVGHELNIDSKELYALRTPREQAMDSVMADLTFACVKLPASWGDGNAPGRLSRWAALLVKSRVCLFEGTWRKYHGGKNPDMWLKEAADAAKELMDKGPYTLYSSGDPLHDYNAYHRATDLTGNKEVIYWRKYQLGVITNHVMSYHVGYNGGATKSMVEDYLCTDGLPVSLSPLYKGDAQIENVFINRDPRLRQTILHTADQAYYNYDRSLAYTYPRVTGMAGGQIGTTGYHIIKAYESVAAGNAYNTSTTPAITLRLGEALLNYAEAKAELSTLTQADLDISINKLRDRVGMIHMNISSIPVDPRYVSDAVSPLIVEIRRERRVELFMEGFRYDDLRRWKQGKKLEIPSMGILWDAAAIARFPLATVKTSVDPVSGKTYINVYKGTDWDNPVFDESKHYLWPIPLSALSQNPELKQNPNW
ncbi:MAG: RagB/SusD family nutrient uptake outer membrane protein [Chitinophagaceae bacterium]